MKVKEITTDAGNKLGIFLDDDPSSPREWDNLGTMVAWHPRYILGDENEFSTPDDFYEWLEDQKVVILPLYLYDHSGIAISTNSWIGRAQHAEWDSGVVGCIYVTLDDVRKEYSRSRVTKKLREQVEEVLRQEVASYSQYISGQVLGYVLEDSEGELIDSLFGWYGDRDSLIEEALSIEQDISQEVK